MWNWIVFLGPPVLFIVVARRLIKRQDQIDAGIDQGHQDPPAGDYLGRLGGGKMG